MEMALPVTDYESEEAKMSIASIEWPNAKREISFSSQCLVVEIPNRESYSTEEAKALWVPATELKELTERNMLEFAAEGWSPRDVVEEQDMVMDVDGTFLHPIHLNPMLKAALLKNCPYPRAVSPDEIMHDVSLYPSVTLVDRPSSPFVETVVNQDYFPEDDDQLLLSDPDGYLMKRFAHHCTAYDDTLLGDAEDAIVNQMLR